MLIVHAASLENQFVAGGFSYKNQFGHAIFTNDFVLAGPTGIRRGSRERANNIAQAFADVATAGAAGKATFVSRGGPPGRPSRSTRSGRSSTTPNSLPPASLLCTVTPPDGGGACHRSHRRSRAGLPRRGAVDGRRCRPGTGNRRQPGPERDRDQRVHRRPAAPNRATSSPIAAPSTTCLRDGPGRVDPNLKILTRDNSASAPGGANALINYFHAYIINPDKPGETVNVTAAQDFVNFLTSPAFQSQLKNYLPAARSGRPAVHGRRLAEHHGPPPGFPTQLHGGQDRSR